jgi:hypothetical protein
MDANSGLAILGTAIGSAKLVEKVLDPTAEYVGAGLRDFAQHRVENVKRIFYKASIFLGDSPPAGQAVHQESSATFLMMDRIAMMNLPRHIMGASLLHRVPVFPETTAGQLSPPCWQDSPLINFELTTFYTGLSTHSTQQRTEIYRAVLGELSVARSCRCKIIWPRMQPELGEPLSAFAAHVFFGLQREALIGQEFQFGAHEELKTRFPAADSSGLLFEPSALGIELFLWATGNSSLEINAISSEMIKVPELGIPVCKNAKPTKT